MRCDYCGAPYDDKDHFCRNCGVRFKDPADASGAELIRPSKPDPKVAERRRRTKRALTMAAAGLVILALAAQLVVQLMPDIIYLSMGGKPKDLGVKYTEADYKSILDKTGILADEPPESSDRRDYTDVYNGTKDVDWTFTESELTAWFNMDKQPGYWPFSAVQVRLHADNVIEASLSVDGKKLSTFIAITRRAPQEVVTFLQSLPEAIPVYAKAKITFTGPKSVGVEVLGFEAANLPVSAMGMSEQANQILSGILGDMFASIEQANIDEFSVNEGSMHMKGEWYEEIKRIPTK